MSGEKNIPLLNYILYSLSAAWKLVRIDPRAMEYFDLSSDGFWKSFWAIAVIIPIFCLNLLNTAGSDTPQPFISSIVYLVTGLPVTAVVMYYFTRFMDISDHYVSMIIAYNWLNALTFNIVVIATILIIALLPSSQLVLFIILLLRFYLGGYVAWFMFVKSLRISGWLAIGVLIFEVVFNVTYQMMLMRYIDAEAFQVFLARFNNPPA